MTPEATKERFVQNHTEIFYSTPHQEYPNTEIVYIENLYDPDPEDTTMESTHVYFIRQNGELTIETDKHKLGLFSISEWEEILAEMNISIKREKYSENGHEYLIFFCLKL